MKKPSDLVWIKSFPGYFWTSKVTGVRVGLPSSSDLIDPKPYILPAA